LAVLTRRGVTGWRHALATIIPTTPLPTAGPPARDAATAAPASVPASTLPRPIAAELVNALAAVALASS
jgi:hypothetical protein